MFGIPSTRIAELSRPDRNPEFAEYARLEHRHEDPRTVLLLALAAQEKVKERRPLRSLFRRLLRLAPAARDAAPANG
ncbi:MAG: hypothetical protein L3J97_06995 [Thermoplasmata archaeon]|nr:hypothetical protein [Thermoplasmata archaeon]